MNNVVIIVHGGAAITFYLEKCDFEAEDGRGKADWTTNPNKAKRFADKAEAFEYWQTQSKTHPTRPDGRPNRPLTAYTVEIRAIP